MASLEDFKLERRILCVFDYDLTLTEEYQQTPLFETFFGNIKKAYDNSFIPKKDENGSLLIVDGKYVPDTDESGNLKTLKIEKPIDYFKVVDAWFPLNNGVGYLELIKRDIRRGIFPITRKDLLEFGAKVKLSPGLPEFMHELKREWEGKCYLQTAIISVGIKDMILGSAVGKAVDRVEASELTSLEGPEFLTETYANMTPFNKSEAIIILAKGGRVNLNKKVPKKNYAFQYYNIICTGDGMSDVNHFAYTEKKGGTVNCVYKKEDQAAFDKIIANTELMERIHFLLPRDYAEGSAFRKILNERIESILSSKCTMNKILVDTYKKRKLGSKKIDEEMREHIHECKECQFFTDPVRKVAPAK